MRDELFLSLMTHYINAWNANYDIPGVTRRGHDGVCLMSEHRAACFEELLREHAALLPMSLCRDLENSKRHIQRIIHRVLPRE